MNRNEILRLYYIIRYTIFISAFVANISMADDNNSITQDNSSGWFGVIIGVILPALLLIILIAIIYIKLNQKRKKDEQTSEEHGLRVTSTSRRNEQDLSISNEELWESDESANTLEEITLNALHNATQLYEANKIRTYYAAISSIIKRYVGAKFSVKVADSTTGEILDNLPQELTESTIDHVGEILRICDLVEFSQYKPSRNEAEQIYQLSFEFIESQREIAESEDNESRNSETDELDEIYEQFKKMQKQRWR